MEDYCGSCSDSTGRLLFYTNGISIQNSEHKLMENGDSLNLSEFWYDYQVHGYPIGTGGRAIPAPGKPNQYYFFSMGGRPEISTHQIVLAPLWYSRIDMNQNNGLGRVIEKNVVMMDVPLNEFVFIKHGNGRDWWLLVSRLNQNVHFTYLIDNNGVNGPYTQVFGPPYTELETPSFNSVSPDGQKYVRSDSYKGLNIYDFDRCTGQLSNLQYIPFENGFICVSALFSADSRRLYLDTPYAVLSMDMTATDPPLTLDTIINYDGYSTPEPFNAVFWTGQLHEDGKIYYTTANGTLTLHVMHHPGLPGLAADMEQHGIRLPSYNVGGMCRFPNYRLGVLGGSPCDTLAQAPHPGFTHMPYRPKPSAEFKILSPIRGNGSEAAKISMPEYSLLRARREKKAQEESETQQTIPDAQRLPEEH